MPAGVVDNSYLELGSANVYVDEGAGDIFVGGTSGIDVEVKEEWADLETDQAGVGNRVLVNQDFNVSFNLREIKLEQWRRVLASVKAIKDDADSAKRRLEFRKVSGIDQLSLAHKITIKPIIGGVETTNKEKIIVIPFAAPFADTVKWSYAAKTQREVPARFACLPDAANNNRCLYMGDETAVDATTPFGF